MSFDGNNNWVCPHSMCDGSGRVFEDERQVGRIHCACWPDMIRALAMGMANIPPRYQGKDFSSTVVREQFPNYGNIVDFVKNYSMNWRQVRDSEGWTRADNGGRCLAILSPKSGMGKTHLACAVMQQLIRDHWTESVCHQDVCFFVDPTEWFRKISDHYRKYPVLPRGTPQSDDQSLDKGCEASRKELGAYESRLYKTDLLVIDDFTRHKGGDEKRLERIFDVVNDRVKNRRATLITDNEPTLDRVAKNLGENYGYPIVTRIENNGDVVTIDLPQGHRGRVR